MNFKTTFFFSIIFLLSLVACGSGNETQNTEGETTQDSTTEEGQENESNTAFSHQNWDALLQKHVSEDGVVNYKGFQEDEAQLNEYLELLSQGIPEGSKEETMVYWVNAYNAFTIRLILDNYPLKSIMDINDGKAWDLDFITINDEKYTLNQIEKEILLVDFFDARLHFILVCAAKSCPKLLNKAYTVENLETEMENQSKYFLNNADKNKIEAEKAQVSQLFNWYQSDFTKDGTVIEFLNQYANTKINEGVELEFLEYDWSLNE